MSKLRKDDLEAADDLVESGQRLYDERLHELFEPSQVGCYVVIEPVSGQYFVSDTGTEALLEARRTLPRRCSTWRASATLRPTPSAAMTVSDETN